MQARKASFLPLHSHPNDANYRKCFFTDKTFLKALPFDVAAIQMKLICFLQLAFRPPSDLAEMVLHVHVKLTIQDDAIQILQSQEITDPKWVVNNLFLNYESPHVSASQDVGQHSYLHLIAIVSYKQFDLK